MFFFQAPAVFFGYSNYLRSFFLSHYTTGNLKTGNSNVNIEGNKIESVPNIISRNVISVHYWKISLSGLYSYTATSFADALNTLTPTATGAIGLVPSYGIFDLNSTIRINSKFEIKASLNNVFNKQYFTKRPLFYPGLGIWASDGRNESISFVVSI